MRRAVLALAALASLAVAGCTAEPSSTPAPAPTPGAAFVCDEEIAFPPMQDLASIRAEIERRAAGRFSSIGDGANTVIVGLWATEECLARQIAAAYGPRVELTVGWLPFPPQGGLPRQCPIGDWPFGVPPFVKATLDLPDQVKQGASFKGMVELRNTGLAATTLDTSSNFPVHLFAPGNLAPLGGGEGARMGTGLGLQLGPGVSRSIDAFGGSASCVLDLGYVLPVGRYEARALIDWSPPEGGVRVFWSDARPIEVIAR